MPEGDKRRRPRAPATGTIAVVTASGQRIRGQAMDVSLMGCRFSAEELLQVGEPITTSLQFPSGKVHEVAGTIKFVAGVAPFQYGVEFTQETTERIIKTMIKVV